MMKHQVVAPTMLEGLRAEAKKERETVEVMQKGGEVRWLSVRRMGVWLPCWMAMALLC